MNIDDIKAKVEKIEHLLLSEFEKTLKQLQESIVNLTQGQEKHKKSCVKIWLNKFLKYVLTKKG